MDEQASKLDDMIAEAGGGAPEISGEGQGAPVVPVSPALLPDYIKGLTGSAVTVVGAIVCDKARVTRLEQGEVVQLSDALANVLRFYLTVDGLDEKAVAWLTVGAVAIGVIGNRRPLAPPQAAAVDHVPSPPEVPADVVAAQMDGLNAIMETGDVVAAAGA